MQSREELRELFGSSRLLDPYGNTDAMRCTEFAGIIGVVGGDAPEIDSGSGRPFIVPESSAQRDDVLEAVFEAEMSSPFIGFVGFVGDCYAAVSSGHFLFNSDGAMEI